MLDPAALFHFESVFWSVPESLPYFQGHFPGRPVLPAVAIFDASLEFLRRFHSRPGLRISKISHAKFLKPVTPGLRVRLENRIVEPGVWDVEWSDAASLEKLANLRLGCRDEDSFIPETGRR